MSQKLNQIINALEKRLQSFVDYRKQKKWKFKAGKSVFTKACLGLTL